jgi:hypothetical protein
VHESHGKTKSRNARSYVRIKADTSLCKYNVEEEENTEIPTILKKSSIQR